MKVSTTAPRRRIIEPSPGPAPRRRRRSHLEVLAMGARSAGPSLSARVVALESELASLRASQFTSPRPTARRGPLRSLVVAGLLVIVAILPMASLASDSFTDVPDSNIFHAAINRLYGSRIATGCGASVYCPDASVTRGQMAAFLNRGLGRVGYRTAPVNADVTGGGSVEVNTIQVQAGSITGGYGMLKVDVSATTIAWDVSGCPCQVGYSLWIEGAGSSNVSYTQVGALAGGIIGRDSASVTWAVRVPSGTTVTVYLFAHLQLGSGGAGDVTASGDMTVLYVPFDAFGTNNSPVQSGS
jgi:hypothetical protein